jgi:hypothetical protein
MGSQRTDAAREGNDPVEPLDRQVRDLLLYIQDLALDARAAMFVRDFAKAERLTADMLAANQRAQELLRKAAGQ